MTVRSRFCRRFVLLVFSLCLFCPRVSGSASGGVVKGQSQAKQMGGDGGRVVSPPIIIVDPGHGGKDPGAIFGKKIREKEVVFSISKKLAARLREKATVFLTRGGDRFISLDQRDRIANQHQCDLFLSIHANASKDRYASGIELYYLNKASDEASRRLAARENEGAPGRQQEIEGILSDLLQTASTEESAELAQRVKKVLQGRLRKKYGPQEIRIKTALFYVLVGAKCPSLLIEVGFITNPSEGARLRKAAYQRNLVGAIVEGVSAFLKERDQPRDNL